DDEIVRFGSRSRIGFAPLRFHLQFAEPPSGEQRCLDRAGQLRSTEMRLTRIQYRAPFTKQSDRLMIQPSAQRCAPRRIQWRSIEQRLEQRADVESGAADK